MNMVGKEVQTVTKDKVIAVGTKAVPKPVVAAATTSKATTTSKSSKVSAKSNNVTSKAGVDFEYKK